MFDWSKRINKRVTSIKPSGIRKFFDVVNTMPDAISLGVGEPDFATPYYVREAAIRSIQKGQTQYTSNLGMPALRELIAKFLNQRYKLDYNPSNEILVTVGASEAIDVSLRTILDFGDEVLIPEPCYVSYAPCVLLCGAIPKCLPVLESNDFRITKEILSRSVTDRTRAIIFPYPNNPTGAIMRSQDILPLLETIKKHDLIVVSDEIYSELTFENTHSSIASFEGMKERTIVINGFSKAFAMTGWRIGYIAAPKEMLAECVKIHQYTIMCAPTVAQVAAIAALKYGFEDDFAAVREMREEYDKRRRLMYHALNNLGLHTFEPLGAFYLFPNVSSTNLDGERFAEELLNFSSVAVVPGQAFGESGKNFVRCCYAVSMANINEALKRMENFLTNLKTISS